ncbi:hypothetical protein ILYODFUR_023861 [Ilyodon furcidens]|uniref:Uncharacterized protein n=1 Tax=Ilyodon furcidens TaxID=33524 RepID=A0ABV0TBY1_9TELE
MDVSVLSQQYRISREKQRRTEPQLVRTDFDELSDTISIVPVPQGWTSPWKPASFSPPVDNFDSDPKMFDPWHVHLDLHRRCRPAVNIQTELRRCRCSCSSPSGISTTNLSLSDCFCSSTDTCSFTEEHLVGSNPGSGSSDGCSEGFSRSCLMGQAPGSKNPTHSSSSRTTERVYQQSKVQGSGASTTNLDQNQEKNQSARSSGFSSSRNSQHLQTPTSRFSHQLNSGGGSRLSRNHYPFPSRKTPKISEAVRRLGLYSSF